MSAVPAGAVHAKTSVTVQERLFCSVQVEFLFVLLRLWRPLRLQLGVHCMCSCQCEEASYASCCGQPAVCMLTPCGRYVRSQEKLMNMSNTMDSRDEMSHTVLIFDCHALPHGILYVHVESLWEPTDQVQYRSPRLALWLYFRCPTCAISTRKNRAIAHSTLVTKLTVLAQEQAVYSVLREFASFHLRLLFPNSSMRKWHIWAFRHSMWSSPSSRLR